jgi:formylglycine-generating enzyme required for sulfatase activity
MLTLNRSPENGGTVTRSPNQGSYFSGTVVTITATANEAIGFKFVNWSGAGVADPNSATTTVTITSDMTVTANFGWAGDGPTPEMHTLTLDRSPENGGTVTRNPIAATYFSGTVVTITATANAAAGFRFVNWSGAGVADPNSSTTTVSVTSDMIVTANFELNTEMEMVFVQGGTFVMGCTPEQGELCGDVPVHQVTLSSFFIGKYPVTQAQWLAVMGSNPSQITGNLLRPVESVTWNDIVNQFIPKLNEMTGITYRLPTEAEWEFAARGGTNTRRYRYSGSDDINEVAWYSSNSGIRTHPVGTKAPNELGIYDMSGNVQEQVNDWRGSYTAEAKIDPTGPSSGSSRVARGGSWECRIAPIDECRVSFRGGSGSFAGFGFRLAISP